MVANALTRSGLARSLDRLEWVILGFVAVLTVSFLATVPFKDLNTIRNDLALLVQVYLMPWLSILIARRMEWTERDVVGVLRLLTIVGLLLVVIGILQYVFKIPLFKPLNMEVIHEGRTTGTFANAVEYGSVVGATAIMTMAQYVSARGAFFKGVLLSCAGAMVGAVILCLTRSPLVGLAVAFAYLFATDGRIRLLFAAGLIIGPAVAIVLVPVFVDVDALAARFGEVEPIYNRLALLATACKMILAHPILGVGFGRHAFAENSTDYLTGFGSVSAQWAAGVTIPHLEFLHIAVLTGLLGLGFYLWAWLELLRVGRQIYRDPVVSPFIRTAALYATAVLISVMANGLYVDFIAYNYCTAMAVLLMGIISAAARATAPARV
jgi:O-antigen ligase